MTKQEALRYFRENIQPYAGNDPTSIRTAWNYWTDSLQKDGQITQRQYDTWLGPRTRKTRRDPQPKKGSRRKARIDRKGTAKPRSRIVGRFPEGQCIGPQSAPPGGYEYRESKPRRRQRDQSKSRRPGLRRDGPGPARRQPGCPTGTQVQSVILSQQFFSLREAEDWILSHDFRVSKIDESRNFWRFRQQPPTWFKKGTFRTIRLRPGVEAIVGCPL